MQPWSPLLKTSCARWFGFMAFSVVVGWLPTYTAAQATKGPVVSVGVTTRLSFDGKVAPNRLYQFEFRFQTDGQCSVMTMDVNNLACTEGDKHDPDGIWLSSNYCDRNSCGSRFKCELQVLPSGLLKMWVTEPLDIYARGLKGQFVEHEVTTTRAGRVVEYVGSWKGGSRVGLLLPLTSSSNQRHELVDLGCNKIRVPVVAP